MGYLVKLKPKGFLIFSCDKNIKPVIAYSFNNDWPENADNSNPLYYMVVQDLKFRNDNIDDFPLQKKLNNQKLWNTYLNFDIARGTHIFYQWPPEGTTETGGWVNTAWTQYSPYNDFCPLDPNTQKRSVVGCVATAFSQIVNYHKYIGNLQLSPEYMYLSFKSDSISLYIKLVFFPTFYTL